jgi:hypothetical protein
MSWEYPIGANVAFLAAAPTSIPEGQRNAVAFVQPQALLRSNVAKAIPRTTTTYNAAALKA